MPQTRLNLFTRTREMRRTLWQLTTLRQVGRSGMRMADEVISTGQCLQRKWELLAMMAAVKKYRPHVVVEIGTYRGGTLRCWGSVCPSTTQFFSIDLPGGDFGGGYNSSDVDTFRGYLRPGQSLRCLRADSHDPTTYNALVDALGGRRIDFLFIDGDHTYEGVRRDYELYGTLVRPGGIIALHDIMPHQVHSSCQVHRFWADLKAASNTSEFVDRDGFETWGGIGVVMR